MEMDDRAVWALALVIIAAMAMRYLPRFQARAPFIRPKVLQERLDAGDDVVVIDVRTESEFAGRLGHVPQAINVPVGDLKARLIQKADEVEGFRHHPIYVYCMGEMRAAQGARALVDAKFNRVSVVKGGLKAWIRGGHPVERDA